MIECPSAEEIRQLLDGDSEPDRASRLRAHVETCEGCLATLERLSDDPALASWLDGAGPDATRAARESVRKSFRAAEAPASLGVFAIEAEIGRGGMGTVYRARDRHIGRVVALKVLRSDLVDDRARRRFLLEARAAGTVEHDHIVRLYGTSDPDEATPYLVLEFIDGPSLAERIRESGPLDPRTAARVIAEVGEGIAAAHAAGLVHRDVKPANILIDSASGRARIGDFGLARVADDEGNLTQDGSVAGTPAYLSPEQARGEAQVGPLADVYSLGISLYESLAGEPPFRGTAHRILRQILDDEPKPPRSLNDGIPWELQTICLKAIEKDPSRRYRGAGDVSADLRRWLAGEPIQARPSGLIGRAWKLARRRPVASLLSLSLMVALIAGVSGIAWQWRRAEANARQSREYLGRALDTIDGYLTNVGENRLLDVPSLQPLRKELLASATSSYEALLRERPGDPAIRAELARARMRLASVTAIVGTYDEAMSQLNRSLEEFDAIVRQTPSDLAARDGRLTCLSSISATQLRDSRLDDCARTLERQIAEAEEEFKRRRSASVPPECLYAAHHTRAQVWNAQRKPAAEVAAEYERAIEANSELLWLQPGRAAYLRNLSRTAGMLAEAYFAANQPAKAQEAFDQGFNAARVLVKENPASLEYRFALAYYEGRRGSVDFAHSAPLTGELARAKLEEARTHITAAAYLVRSLVRESPQVDVYRLELVGQLTSLGLVEYASGRFEELHRIADEALRTMEGVRNEANGYAAHKPILAILLLNDAYALAETGRKDEAIARLDRIDATLKSVSDRERAALPGLPLTEAVCACGRVSILIRLGSKAEADRLAPLAVAKIPPPLRPLIEAIQRLERGQTVREADALALGPVAESVLKSGAMVATVQLLYARLFALAADAAKGKPAAERFRGLATYCVTKAAETGYFRDPDHAREIDADPILKGLRPR